MPQRLRIALLVLGLVLVCCSLAALGYAFWPDDVSSVQATLAPTLFVAP